MITKMIKSFHHLDKITLKIMKIGIKFCFMLSIISCIILLTYQLFIPSPNTYYIGLAILKLSIYFMIDFIICGIVVDSIKNKLI